MLDLNLVDLEMDLTSNLTLNSTLLLAQALRQWMNMTIVMPMDMLMPRRLVMLKRDMVILTVKRVMDTIMDLPRVTIMDTRMVGVVILMGR
jgi:hypothetical protein